MALARQYDRSVRPERCPVCSGELMHGRAELRIGSGGTVATFVDAGSAWSFLPVETATCLRCGHMDLYATS